MHRANAELDLISTGKSFIPWHSHEKEDKLFVVRKGELQVQLRDRTVTLGPGEEYIVPRGVEHQTVANDEAEIHIYDAVH